MGMYTSLTFRAKLNPFGLLIVKGLLDGPVPEPGQTAWGDVAWAFPRHEWLAEWSEVQRCDHIPFGAAADPHRWKICGGVWDVSCALKDRGDTIGKFLEWVLPRLIEEPLVAEVWYEEWERPQERRVEPWSLA